MLFALVASAADNRDEIHRDARSPEYEEDDGDDRQRRFSKHGMKKAQVVDVFEHLVISLSDRENFARGPVDLDFIVARFRQDFVYVFFGVKFKPIDVAHSLQGGDSGGPRGLDRLIRIQKSSRI